MYKLTLLCHSFRENNVINRYGSSNSNIGIYFNIKYLAIYLFAYENVQKLK